MNNKPVLYQKFSSSKTTLWMLNKATVQKLVVAGVNIFILSAFGFFLSYIQYMFFKNSHLNSFDIVETSGVLMFFILLIYTLYGLLFVVILYKKNYPISIRCLVCGLTAPIVVYLFIVSFGGSRDLLDLKFLSGLLIFFIIGFLLPYFQTKLLRFIDSN